MYRAAFVMIALALAPGTVVAQVSIDTPLVRLNPGQFARARTLDGRRIQSRVLAIDLDPFTLHLVGHETPLPAASIDSLWVRGRATKTGAIIGAVGAGVPSFAFWAVFCEAMSEGDGCDEWGTVTGLALAGAGGGALIGAAIGAAVPKWRLRYARQHGTTAITLVPIRRVGLMVSTRF
jgi:hypothetical protein